MAIRLPNLRFLTTIFLTDFWVLIKYFRKLNFYVKNGSKKSIYELSYLILSNCCSKIMIMFSVILKNYMVEMRPFFKKKTIIIFKKPSLLFNIWNYQFIFIWQYCYVFCQCLVTYLRSTYLKIWISWIDKRDNYVVMMMI